MYQPRAAPAVGGSGTALGVGTVLTLTPFTVSFASTCSGGGNAWLMVLNFTSGAAFPLPELDVNGDATINRSDLPASGNVPVGMLLGAGYASTPTLLPSGGAQGGTNKLTALSNVGVKSVLDRGRGKQRISWWEVRH